jgi:hypothetical protein
MLHDWIYEELDPQLRWKIYLTRKKLLGSLESPTILPENGLTAEDLLTEEQLTKVSLIRSRRLASLAACLTNH